MTRAKSLTVLTPWYPTPLKPFDGAFVEAMVEAVAPLFDEVDVVHADAWGFPVARGTWHLPAPRLIRRMLVRRYRQLVNALPDPFPQVGEHGQRRIPVLVNPDGSFARMARNYTEYLRLALPEGRLRGDVVHAHVGLRGGWPALELAKPGAQVYVTEHATYLDKVLCQPDSKAMYDSVIERSTRFFCVSEVLRDRLLRDFPQHADKISILPNPIPFEDIRARAEQPKELRRWLFAGFLIERKGVRQLLEAFAQCHREGTASELTIVGAGRQLAELERRTTELGLTEQVRFTGGVSRERLFEYMLDNDLLVHPSSSETFGMTVVEAIASGMPVLVTDCGGPAETLAGTGGRAGTLVPLGADGTVDVADLVRGFHELADRVTELDLPAARAALAAKYSYQAMQDVAAAHYFSNDQVRESTA